MIFSIIRPVTEWIIFVGLSVRLCKHEQIIAHTLTFMSSWFLGANDLVEAAKRSSHRQKMEFATEYAETIQNEKNELNAMI